MTIMSREIRQGQMSWKDGQLAGRKMFESPLIANGQEDHPFLPVIVPLVNSSWQRFAIVFRILSRPLFSATSK